MTVGIVATIKIQAGKNAEFEAVAKEMMAAVRANEPGNKVLPVLQIQERSDHLCCDGALRRSGRHGIAWHVRSFPLDRPEDGPLHGGPAEVAYYDAV
jgi:hypothetical protein